MFAQAGSRTALVRSATATVLDGVLNIGFVNQVEDPFVNAIEIYSRSSTDATPPTAPGAPVASIVGPGRIDLAWAAASDASGISGYQVERCQGAACTAFEPIGAAVTPAFVDGGLPGSLTLRYRVRAFDAAGNVSGYSNVAAAVTPANIAVPCGSCHTR